MAAMNREPVETLSALLDRIDELFDREGESGVVRVRQLLHVIGARAYGPLILAIGLLAVSPIAWIPGVTWGTALLALIVSSQMAVGCRTPWLPKFALDCKLSRAALASGIAVMKPWTRRIDRVVRPRMTFLTSPPFANMFAVLCTIAALTCFPLGLIPFAPTGPTFAIALVGLGLTFRDGLVLAVSALPVGVGIWLVL